MVVASPEKEDLNMACCWCGFEFQCPCECKGGTGGDPMPKPGENLPPGWTSSGVFCFELYTKHEDGECKVRMRPVECNCDGDERGPDQEEASVG
jgi:hypothetical protein